MTFPKTHTNGETLDAVWANDLESRVAGSMLGSDGKIGGPGSTGLTSSVVLAGSDGKVGGPGGTPLTADIDYVGSNGALYGATSGQAKIVRSDGTVAYVNTEILAAAWNVKFDGVTDDTVALQNAVTAAAGKLLKLPIGNGLITSPISVPSSTTIAGQGWGSQITMNGAWAGANGCLLVQGNAGAHITDVTISDLWIEGQRASKAAGSTARGIYCNYADHVTVTRCKITDPSHAAVLVDGVCTDVKITGNYAYRGGDNTTGQTCDHFSVGPNFGGPSSGIVISHNYSLLATDAGIGLHDNCTDIVVSGNVIDNAAAAVAGYAMDIAGVQRVSITGNTIKNFPGSNAIYIHQDLNTYNPSDITVTGNTIDFTGSASTTAIGIQINGTAANPASRITITGNNIHGAPYTGIYVSGAVLNSTITGNTIDSCGGPSGAGNAAGISLIDTLGTQMKDVTVTGNTVTNNTGYGVYLHPATANCKVQGNTLDNNSLGSTNATFTQRQNCEFAQNGPQDSYNYGSTNTQQAILGAQTVTTTTEKVLATTTAVQLYGQTVSLNGFVDITTATGTTTVQVYIRRGTTTAGTQVQRVQATVTAGDRVVVPIAWTDSPGAQSAQQYCVTVAAVGATANASANSSSLTADY